MAKTIRKVKTDSIEGKVCKNCGHVIYKVKYRGYRCWCDKPEVK